MGRGHQKRGEATERDCWLLEYQDAVALRRLAGDYGITDADMLHVALNVGTAGLAEPDARFHAQAQLRQTAEILVRAKNQADEARRQCTQEGDRYKTQVRRARQLTPMLVRQRRWLRPQARHEAKLLADQLRKHVDADDEFPVHVDVDDLPQTLHHFVDVVDVEVQPRRRRQRIGQRIAASMRRSIRNEAERTGKTATEIVSVRVRRYLQLHGRDPQIQKISFEIHDRLQKAAALRTFRRQWLRAARRLQIRRQRIRRLLEHGLRMRGHLDRDTTIVEKVAIEAQLRDPRCLEKPVERPVAGAGLVVC